ncbi:MAG: HD domain-containing protein [Bacteroidales bacterium]|nr:HD domain-containing protein [Bacteroidales bacterium]
MSENHNPIQNETVVESVGIHPELREYVEREILPRYDHFDQAHRRDHAWMVIRQSLEMASHLEVDKDMVYAIAAYHDTGLCEGRELHHEASARILRSDRQLRRWFTEEQIETMDDAAEDHRASAKQAPRTVYGRIVAEADRFIDPVTIVRRTVQYGRDHYPDLSREEHFQRMVNHLNEKYGRNGYLKLWFTESPNTARLEKLRQLMGDERTLRGIFDQCYGSV